MKIIRHTVNDHTVSLHFFRFKSVCIENGQGIAIIFKQRREVSGMVRMHASPRIVVQARIRKRIIGVPGTGVPLMDVEPEYIFLADSSG